MMHPYSQARRYYSALFVVMVVNGVFMHFVTSCCILGLWTCHAFAFPSIQSTTKRRFLIEKGILPLKYQVVEQQNERMAAVPDLNQIGSISTDSPAVLLHAGPGSGKSRVLSARICHLLQRGNRSGIFVLSFSKNDALRIRQRAIHQFVDLKAKDVRDKQGMEKYITRARASLEQDIWAGTFHGLAAAILRRFRGDPYHRIAHGWEQRKHLASALDKAKSKAVISLDLYAHAKADCKGSDAHLISSMLSVIQFWKESNMLIPIAPYFLCDTSANSTINYVQRASDQLCISQNVASIAHQIYPYYQVLQDEYGLIDAADLPLLAIDFLKKNKKALDKIRSQVVKHIILDEYQDNSNAQQEFLKLLVCGIPRVGRNVMYTSGDANQSIYGWRGAKPKQTVRNFLADFPQGLVIPLETSYRLPSHILTAAESIISNDVLQPIQKPLKSFPQSPAARTSLYKSSSKLPQELHEWEKRVMIKELWDPRAEAQWIATEIGKRFKVRQSESLKGSTFHDFNEIAIMVRTSSQMREIEEALSQRKIPFSTEGSPDFNQQSKLYSPNNRKQNSSTSSLPLRRASTYIEGTNYIHVNPSRAFYERKEIEVALTILRDLHETKLSDDESFLTTWRKVIFGSTWKDHGEDDRMFLLNLFFSKVGIVSGLTGKREVAERILKGMQENVNLKSLLNNNYLHNNAENSLNDKLAMKRKHESINDLCKSASRYSSMIKFLMIIAIGDDTSQAITRRGKMRKSIANPEIFNMTPVRIMTMHRSKGEEFDDVYLCGWEEGTFPLASAVSQYAIEEERRLAYVALTRARQRAVISFAKRHRKSSGIGVVNKKPSRFLIDLLERQGLGKNSVLAIAGGPSIHGIKPLVSGIDTRNYHQQSKKYKGSRVVSNGKKMAPLSTIGERAAFIDQVPEILDSSSMELKLVRNDLQNLIQNREKRSGICKVFREKWREMIATLFDLKRGSALVIDRKAAQENSVKVTDIASMPSLYIKTKPLSQCTALELGLYLEHLLVKQSEREKL